MKKDRGTLIHAEEFSVCVFVFIIGNYAKNIESQETQAKN